VKRVDREQRKVEHVRLALENARLAPSTRDFDDIRFIHASFPEIGTADVSLVTHVAHLPLAWPLYINGMTGGSRSTTHINRDLATAAAETGVAMGVGSQHAALVNTDVADSFRIVRQCNPRGVVFANVGAAVSVDFAQRAVDMLEAQALQVHVNVPQELVMPEGDRDFSGILRNIERTVRRVSVPVIVKEVGFGMVAETFAQLRDVGVQVVDVGGRGGTDFAWIENARRPLQELDYLHGWGQSTPISLLESRMFQSDLTILASGGVRHALDMMKCFALGARAVGVAGPALTCLHKGGVEALIEQLNAWQAQLRTLFTLLGARVIGEVAEQPLLLAGAVRQWCDARGLDVNELAQRKHRAVD